MKQIISSLAASAILATGANAFMGLDAEVGVGVWAPKITGDIGYGNDPKSNQVDMKNLGIDDEKFSNGSYLYADFSHFVPLIPNLRVENLQYTMDGEGSTSIDWNGMSYAQGVSTNIDMEQTDFIAYWGVPFVGLATAGVFNINFGLDLKNIKGDVTVNHDTASFDEYLPLAYLNTKIDLPFAPVNIEGTIKTLSFDGASISDNELKISGVLDLTLIDLKLDLGYRQQNITIPEKLVNNIDADISTEGIFFGVSAKF